LAAADIAKWKPIIDEIEAITVRVVADEDLAHDPHVCNPEDQLYFMKPLVFARDNCVFFMCAKCNSPFYGGHRDCQAAEEQAGQEELPPTSTCARGAQGNAAT
jgi:hypothetical protein